MNDKEKDKRPTPGFGIVGRFLYDKGQVVQAETAHLAPGTGAIFKKGGGFEKFKQEELEEKLKGALEKGDFETLAVLDKKTGGLLFSQGTAESSIGMDRRLPKNQRVVGASLGQSVKYGLIWGETEFEASNTLQGLQARRRRRN